MAWKRRTFKKKTGTKKPRKAKESKLEVRFLEVWMKLCPNLPLPVRQHRFHKKRMWRFDFAWVDQKIAVEIQGGAFIGGGHNTAYGQSQDHEKQRRAVVMGWRLFYFGTHDLQFQTEYYKKKRSKKKKLPIMYRKFTVYDCVMFVADFLEKEMSE